MTGKLTNKLYGALGENRINRIENFMNHDKRDAAFGEMSEQIGPELYPDHKVPAVNEFRAKRPFIKSVVNSVVLGLVLLLFAQLPGCGGQDRITEQQAYTIGLQAYIWGYPLVSNSNRFARFSTVTELRIANHTLPQSPINQICFLSDYVTADEHSIVAPNHDTIYGSAWLDLSAEPIVIRIPDMGSRYWIFEICDFYTDVFASPGTRLGSPPGNYLVVGPTWNGSVPPGIVQVIRAPTHRVYCLPRVLLKGEDDLPDVLPLINSITIAPLSQMDTAPTYIDYAAVKQVEIPNFLPNWVPDDTFWDTLHAAILDTEPRRGEEGMVLSFLAILNMRHDPAVQAGLAAALAEGRKLVEQSGSFGNLGEKVGNGWTLLRTGGRFGSDYLTRAAAAFSFIYYNLLEDAAYYLQVYDADGNLLDGAKSYRLHFTAEELPPCGTDAFWSVTLYGSDHFLVPNLAGIYNIGTVTEGLQYNSDGSLDIYLQNASPPGLESNWLPTPGSGIFELTLRVYIPGENVLNGTYVPPSVTPVQ